MGITVSLDGRRHTDGTEGRVSVVPRTPWVVNSGVESLAPGPFYFKITSSGTLTTLDDQPATVVPSYDSTENMTFTPSGAAYIVSINISGQKLSETWTVDGATDSVSWASLGIKPNATDKITYSSPLTTESPVKTYPTVGDLPAGNYEGCLAYVRANNTYYGNDGSTWFSLV